MLLFACQDKALDRKIEILDDYCHQQQRKIELLLKSLDEIKEEKIKQEIWENQELYSFHFAAAIGLCINIKLDNKQRSRVTVDQIMKLFHELRNAHILKKSVEVQRTILEKIKEKLPNLKQY